MAGMMSLAEGLFHSASSATAAGHEQRGVSVTPRRSSPASGSVRMQDVSHANAAFDLYVAHHHVHGWGV